MCNCNDNINSTEVSSGPAGPTGPQGEAGANAFGITDGLVVSLGGNQYRIPVTEGQMDWPMVGQTIYLTSCGYYTVDSFVADDYIVVTDPLYPDNDMAIGLANTGLKVGPGGVIGPDGATGATGAAGANGADANEWLVTASVPGAGVGNVGDFALDGSTGDIYEKTGVATWTTTGENIMGPQGATGATGPAANQVRNNTDATVPLTIDDVAGATTPSGAPLLLTGTVSVAYTATFYIAYSVVKDITIETRINAVTLSSRTVKQSLPTIVSATGYATITVSGLLTHVTHYNVGQPLTFKISKHAAGGTLTVEYASINYVNQNT